MEGTRNDVETTSHSAKWLEVTANFFTIREIVPFEIRLAPLCISSSLRATLRFLLSFKPENIQVA